jgi:hypothetical protein
MNPSQFPNQAPQQANAVMKSCYKCGFFGKTSQPRCPQCRRGLLFTENDIRIRGAIGIVVGLFLIGIMLVIAVGIGLLLMGASSTIRPSKDIGKSAAGFVGVYLVFGAVMLFGAHAMVVGFWQLIVGRPNRFLSKMVWVFLVLIFVAGGIFRALAN